MSDQVTKLRKFWAGNIVDIRLFEPNEHGDNWEQGVIVNYDGLYPSMNGTEPIYEIKVEGEAANWHIRQSRLEHADS